MNVSHYFGGCLLLLFMADCKEDITRYVDPNIGGVAPLLTTLGPTVHRPNSMVRVFPVTQPGLSDKYFSDKIFGFPINIPAYRDRYVTSLMATSGMLNLNPDSLCSVYDHSLEEVHPWYHHVWLQNFNIDAEWTTTERTVLYSFIYHGNDKSNLILRIAGKGSIEIKPPGIISGWEEINGIRQYFYCILNVPFKSSEIYLHDSLVNKSVCSGDKSIAAALVFDKPASHVEIRTGISYIGMEQAKYNLEKETNGKSFGKIKAEGRAIWTQALKKIEVEGGTLREKKIFYTSLYRAYERMVNISEYGRYYSAYDSAVHDDHGEPFYVDDWLWDTFRSLHPLMTILNPGVQVLQLKSYIRMFEQSGWMPLFPQVYGDEPCMLGNHSAALFADAYAKGLRGFDLEKAYKGIRRNSLEGTLLPWRNGAKTSLDDFYNKYGWFPALPPDSAEPVAAVHPWEKRQSVAVTLEQSLDDGCTALLAKALGKQDDYKLFLRRSQNYRNVYNPLTGFMSPKRANGQWVEPFDPQLSAWYGGRMYFAENNSYTWTWNVTHDIPGLIELMGGKQNFSNKLDELFNTGPRNGKWMFMGQFPDASGLQGMFVAGNEPSFHIPYLYNYCGEYWKTQRRIRQIMDVWFDDSPLGLPGDEDGGAMCAWYVFSAMGFYPVTPGNAEYAIGSPVFRKIIIHLENGKMFMIEAKNCSPVNKYIQSASLNGKQLKDLFFTHKDIIDGGYLLLEMGSKPRLVYE